MKLIIAFVQPFKLDEIRQAVKAAGATGMSVTGIMGFGRQSGQTETYRGAEYNVDFIPKMKLEILADDSISDALVTAIQTTAGTGSIGDGKIIVMEVADAVRIRTGEHGREAI